MVPVLVSLTALVVLATAWLQAVDSSGSRRRSGDESGHPLPRLTPEGHLDLLLRRQTRIVSVGHADRRGEAYVRFADNTHVLVRSDRRGGVGLLALTSQTGRLRLAAIDRGTPTLLLLGTGAGVHVVTVVRVVARPVGTTLVLCG